MHSYIKPLQGRYFFYHGKPYLAQVDGQILRLTKNEVALKKIALNEHRLFLPASLFRSREFQERIDCAAHIEPNLQSQKNYELFGNAVVGIRRGFRFEIVDGIFHRPHFLVYLWKKMLLDGIFVVSAVLPSSSPYTKCFGVEIELAEISLASDEPMGIHFFGVKNESS